MFFELNKETGEKPVRTRRRKRLLCEKNGVAANTDAIGLLSEKAFLACRKVGRLASISFVCRANRLGFAAKEEYRKIKNKNRRKR